MSIETTVLDEMIGVIVGVIVIVMARGLIVV